MIHHLSISAHDPKHVAQILVELFQGETVLFPDAQYLNSYVALALDDNRTTIDAASVYDRTDSWD